MAASHPSTPPVPLSRKISIAASANRNAGSDADSLSENEENQSPDNSLNSSQIEPLPAGQIRAASKSGGDSRQHLPPDILEKIMKRGATKSAKRAARISHQKRVRKAQEIQRQLEELDVQHKALEERGIRAEKSLRGEVLSECEEDEDDIDGDLMATWFALLADKNRLVRREQELLVQAKHLELEDRSAKLESELRECIMLDSKSPESVLHEGEVLKELLDISEQREKLIAMMEKDRARYVKEDLDIEAQMRAKGVVSTSAGGSVGMGSNKGTPVRKELAY